MKLCFMCDLHLPYDKNALQYDVLDWAIDDVIKKKTDCIIYAGDVTCDGNFEVYKWFVQKMQGLNIPFIFIPGNSDLRFAESIDRIYKISSPCKNDLNGTLIFAINDSKNTISEEDFSALEEADDDSIVFMHHPVYGLSQESRDLFMKWRAEHKNTMVFFGHTHKSGTSMCNVSLQAMDPDKAIGENPCITYYDTETRELRKAYYFCPVPTDLYGHFGVACYNVADHMEFAIRNKLKNVELRPNCTGVEVDEIKSLVSRWRSAGGENLSIHLPDIAYKDGEVVGSKNLDTLIDLAVSIKADRFTQHVPVVSVDTVRTDNAALEKIADFLANKLNSVTSPVVIGVENMHMTSGEKTDGTRRFGYIPEECLEFMQLLASKCKHKVGINFDIGHARNNAPYSQTYQISTWFSQVGKYIVGYHIHQVLSEDSVFKNHMPITDIYGCLISYASFFRCWAEGKINKAPVVFEMDHKDAYDITLKTFDVYRQKTVFDIHSHTYYSSCGKDAMHELIDTAIENGLSILGISDHNHCIGNRKPEYVQEIRAAAEKYKDRIKIICGMEISTRPNVDILVLFKHINLFDYCLIEHIAAPDSIVGKQLIRYCKELGILCGVAHTDLFEYCDIYGYNYEWFFSQMADNKIFWEMNVNYDSTHNYKEHSYVYEFMNNKEKIDIIKKAGVYIGVGFDSHRYKDYDGFRVHQMYDFLKTNGIKTVDELIIDGI